jgi:hypothetical protein
MHVTRALADNGLLATMKGFRDGTSDADAFAWVPLVATLHAADGALATAYGLGPARPERTTTAHPLPSVAGDVVPVSVAPGSVVAGVSSAAGTLSVLFIEPGHERVFCRTRDRGVTVACRRLGGDTGPRYLIANDDPEALLLRSDANATIAPADTLDAPVFSVGAPLAPSLAARVSGGTLYAVTNVASAMTLARCPRGAPCVTFPLGVPTAREATVLSTGAGRWWLGVAGADASLALVARQLTADAPPADPVTLTPLTSGATLLASCHAEGVTYAAASDGGRAHLLALEGNAAPRILGALTGIGVPAELVCDAAGASLVGTSQVGSCERRGGCGEPIALEGQRRVARVGGELVVVSATRDGGDGLRARHGAPGELAGARLWAVDDDAAHGGVSARDLWLFTAGDHLVLFASGATTVVLWSNDRGERWQASREPVDARPMRLGVVR